MYDVCVLGHVTKDRIVTPGHAARELPGGTAYYVSRAWAALGLSVCVVTKLHPRDEPELLGGLSARGIHVVNRGSSATTVFENRYSGRALNERAQRVEAIADPFEPHDLSGIRARVLHLGPLTRGEAPPEVLSALRGAAPIVSLDGQGLLREIEGEAVRLGPYPELERILPQLDVLKVDDAEAEIMMGEAEPEAAGAALERAGAKEVLVTFADRGSAVQTGGRYTRIPPVTPHRVVDATGCGDTYLAAYLFARLEGQPPVAAAAFASAAASLKLGRYGPFDGGVEDVRAHAAGQRV